MMQLLLFFDVGELVKLINKLFWGTGLYLYRTVIIIVFIMSGYE